MQAYLAMLQITNWVIGDVITVVRFVGTTAASRNVREMLLSICRQVALSLGGDEDQVPTGWTPLCAHFVQQLASFPDDKNLVILLAGIADLSTQHQPYDLRWLPRELKENVKLVLTATPTDAVFHSLVTKVVRAESNFVDLSAPQRATNCGALFDELLWRRGRSLNATQREAVAEAICGCPLPLYARMLVDDAAHWTSSDITARAVSARGVNARDANARDVNARDVSARDVSARDVNARDVSTRDVSNVLPSNVEEYVDALLCRAEERHGVVLVSHALSLLTASLSGLADVEMDDLLSLDDHVLAELYGRSPRVARVPPVAWCAVRRQLAVFLRPQHIDGVLVTTWSSRTFAELVRVHYGFDAQTRRGFHSLLADYFLGDWSGRPKPFTDPRPPPAGLAGLPLPARDLDRLVPSQPLVFRSADGRVRYNLRQFDQVPRQLARARRLAELNDRVLFSYEWLYTKTKALSLDSVLQDCALCPGAETSLLARALVDTAPYVTGSGVDGLGVELSGRLLAYRHTHENIAKLIGRCDEHGARHCALIPNFPYQQTPGSALQYTLTVPGAPTCLALVTAAPLDATDPDDVDRYVLVKDATTAVVHAYDLASGELRADVITSVGRMHVTPNGRHLVIINDTDEKSVKVHDTLTGDYSGHFVPANHVQLTPKHRYRFGPVAVTDRQLCMTVSAEQAYLCLVDLPACSLRATASLQHAATICGVCADGRHVFVNAGAEVRVYGMEALTPLCSVKTTYTPLSIVFNTAGTRAVMVTAAAAAESDNRDAPARAISLLILRRGCIEFDYTFALPVECFTGDTDYVRSVQLSHDQSLLAVTTCSHVLLYDAHEETALRQFALPPDAPDEFLLPQRRGDGEVVDIHFGETSFSADDKFLLATVFRSVCVWHVATGRLLTRLQAPVGIIDALRVSSASPGLVVTHVAATGIVQAWNIGDALGRAAAPDRLTAAVEEIQLAGGRAFVRCRDSDELGVVNMRTGRLLDLLTHAAPVKHFAVTADASRVLVCLHMPPDRTLVNKIWDVPNRRVFHEFGSVCGHAVALHEKRALVCIRQAARQFKAPYHVSLFRFPGGEAFIELTLLTPLRFLLSRPFITPEDRFLVVLSAADYDAPSARHVDPTICAVTLRGDALTLTAWRASELRDRVRLRHILDVRPYARSPYIVIVLYTNERDPPAPASGGRPGYTHCYDFMLFDVCSGVVCERVEALVPPDARLDAILFTSDVSLCIDEHSNVFDMRTGYYRSHIPGPAGVRPRCLALNDTVLLYHDRCFLYAVRMRDGRCTAQLHAHAGIACVRVAADGCTVVVGCEDGRLLSYVLVDSTRPDLRAVLAAIPSRQLPGEFAAPDRVRSWDKLDSERRQPFSRPPSAIYSLTPTDRQLLGAMKRRPRTASPAGDTRDASRLCVVM